MSKAYNLFGPVVVNYWKECLGAYMINADKIDDKDLADWINSMETIVMENLCDMIPDQWYPEDDTDEDGDDEEWEDLPDHDHDED
jgi:hypothetical protein